MRENVEEDRLALGGELIYNKDVGLEKLELSRHSSTSESLAKT